MSEKYGKYLALGVEEYYVYQPGYDPSHGRSKTLRLDITRRSTHGFVRRGDHIEHLDDLIGFVSPRMGTTFVWGPDGYLDVVDDLGTPLPNYEEARRMAESERIRAESERERAEAYAALLRAHGIDLGDR